MDFGWWYVNVGSSVGTKVHSLMRDVGGGGCACWGAGSIWKILLSTQFCCEPKSEVAQLCPTLCDPVDYSLPDSSIHGIFQARYWSGLPCLSPGDLPDPGIEPGRQWHPTPVLSHGESHGRTSLVGCSTWGREEWDTTERLPFHFSLSCFEEWNGNPLQCSCLENPRDGGAWWAAIYGVAQSRTRLKWRSSSSCTVGRLFTVWATREVCEPKTAGEKVYF